MKKQNYTPEQLSNAEAAALEYLLRRSRCSHPSGWFDKGGRWYPGESENLNTDMYRTPTRGYPYSYMSACRSLKHCIALFSADSKLVNKIIKNVRAKLIDEVIDDLEADRIKILMSDAMIAFKLEPLTQKKAPSKKSKKL